MDDAIREAKSFHSVQLAQEEREKDAVAGAKKGGKTRKQLHLQKFLTHSEWRECTHILSEDLCNIQYNSTHDGFFRAEGNKRMHC